MYSGIYLSLILLLASCAHGQIEWSQVSTPSQTPTQSVGFYSSGCLGGSTPLPLDGVGYQVMRPERNRFYAHPEMIALLQDFAKKLDAMQSGLLMSDMSQPRGGPMPSGHTSHQVGLDADVWFWTHPDQRIRSLSASERATLPFVSMLNSNGLVDVKLFKEEQIQKLKVAASYPAVQRIFVNPAIKVYLCATLPLHDLDWLRKLRPWSGHDAHFHVRLYCPKQSPECAPQDPIPDGNGCNEVIPQRATPDILVEHSDENFSHENLLKNPLDTILLPPVCESILRAE